MKKQMSNPKLIPAICGAAVVVIAAVLLLAGREEAYRSILVYEVDGTAVIERADIGVMNAAENLYLESGDRVRVEEASMMRMKLDDDKYITAEENTVFALEAAGNDRDSRTKICLERGAVTNEIQNPLSGASQYETSTPNSVMAVRGTIYRVELFPDGNGGENTKVCCFEGTVGATPILPDGSLGGEVLVPAGSELTILADGTVEETKTIDFAGLPVQAMETLDGLLSSGASVAGITGDELDHLIEEYKAQNGNDGAAKTDASAEESVTAGDDHGAAAQAQGDPTAQTDAGKQSAQTTASADKSSGDGKKAGSRTGKNQSGGSKAKDEALQDAPPAAPVNPPQVVDQTPGENTQTDDPVNEEPEDNQDDRKKKPDKTATCKVTFTYQGETFATQQVKSGAQAAAPLLAPAQSGSWDFDFNTKIRKDTTILWKQ